MLDEGDAQTNSRLWNKLQGRKEYDAVVVYLVILSRKCYAENLSERIL